MYWRYSSARIIHLPPTLIAGNSPASFSYPPVGLRCVAGGNKKRPQATECAAAFDSLYVKSGKRTRTLANGTIVAVTSCLVSEVLEIAHSARLLSEVYVAYYAVAQFSIPVGQSQAQVLLIPLQSGQVFCRTR